MKLTPLLLVQIAVALLAFCQMYTCAAVSRVANHVARLPPPVTFHAENGDALSCVVVGPDAGPPGIHP